MELGGVVEVDGGLCGLEEGGYEVVMVEVDIEGFVGSSGVAGVLVSFCGWLAFMSSPSSSVASAFCFSSFASKCALLRLSLLVSSLCLVFRKFASPSMAFTGSLALSFVALEGGVEWRSAIARTSQILIARFAMAWLDLLLESKVCQTRVFSELMVGSGHGPCVAVKAQLAGWKIRSIRMMESV